MPPYDAMGCPTKKFQYGKDCVCENSIACRGLTAAFSMLGADPRSHFVRLPNYKEKPTDPYFVERNKQREAYLRYLLPNHPVEQETLAKDVALHHFHPRVVARLVSKLQKNIPRTMTEKELKRLKLKVDERDKLYDEDGNFTGRCIFAPSYPIEKSKEDLKRLLRLCRTLNEAKDREKNAVESKTSSPKVKKRKKRKFDPDIRNEGDLVVNESSSEQDREDSVQETGEDVIVDSLAEHNIQSLLESIIRLEPIPENPPTLDDDEDRICNLKVESRGTQETEVESVSSGEEAEIDSVMHNKAIVSMQIRLEKLHTGKGKNRMTKMMKKPSPFFDVSVLHEGDDSAPSNRETIYRSYPLSDTKNATWDAIEELDLNVDIHTPQDLNFCVTVYDCDMKGGNHLLIGTCEVNALDLLITSSMSVPIRRDDKVKGFLEISNFQLHADKFMLEDDSVVSSREVAESVSNDTADEQAVETVSNIQDAHPESPTSYKTRLEFHSPARSEKEVSVVTPDGSEALPPASSPARVEEQPSPTRGDEEMAADYHESSFESIHTDLSSIATLSMPSVSMQVSLEKLHTGKGKKSLAGKITNKKPSPFFDFAVLHQDDEHSVSSQWETLYQSYPLPETKNGTWEPVEDLNLGVLVDSSEDLNFRITVYDCDMKGGNHSLIGLAEVKESELRANATSISIKRGDKVKGVLRFDRFELDWSA